MISVVAIGLLALTLPAAPGPSQPQRVEAPPRSVLWVGAHPDDEILAAPLLAHLCGQPGNRCAFLVLTRGEAGRCLLPGGCMPSLAAVRSRELSRSAKRFGAELVLWNLPDGGGLAGDWGRAAGGEANLIARVAATVLAIDPDTVVTFDPRHGTTCHGDHRTAGGLVLAAVRGLAHPPEVVLLETLAAVTADPFSVRFWPAARPPAAGITAFDVAGPGERRQLWAYVPGLVRTYRSQYPAEAARVLARLPDRQRVVYTAPAERAMDSDAVPTCQ